MARSRRTVTIGLFSRVDYGGDGYRKGLLDIGFQIFKENETDFLICAGGLVAKKPLTAAQSRFVETNLAERIRALKESGQAVDRRALRDELRGEFIKNTASNLAKEIPSFSIVNGKPIKIYIITSFPCDGDIGRQVALELVNLRSDIVYYGKSDERFPTKDVGQRLEVLVPERALWRSEYFSTAVDRIIYDNQRHSAQELADAYLVGGVGSSMHKPRGEAKRTYGSIPMLSRPTGITTAENQVGVVTAQLSKDQDGIRLTNHSLKDLLNTERQLVPYPVDSTSNQKRIIDAIRKGPRTVGLLADELHIERSAVENALKRLLDPAGEWPGLQYDEASRRYDFPLAWFQHVLQYPFVNEEFAHDSIVAFGCLHAGSLHSDYAYFIEHMARFIEQEGATVLVGAGDFIQGLAHNFLEKGEVFGGMNYTDQERFAAHLVASIILKDFKRKFHLPRSTNGKEVLDAVSDALILLPYIPGNHDDWPKQVGVTPLVVFRHELVRCVVRGISDIVKEHRRILSGSIEKIVESKIVETNTFVLPSGLTMEIVHPHMARAKTTSLRAQACLEKSKCHVVIIANFHTAVAVAAWEEHLGQRVALQVGTNNHLTEFEEGKGKVVDFGYGCVHIHAHRGRVVRTTTVFCGSDRTAESLSNDEIMESLEKRYGINFPE